MNSNITHVNNTTSFKHINKNFPTSSLKYNSDPYHFIFKPNLFVVMSLLFSLKLTSILTFFYPFPLSPTFLLFSTSLTFLYINYEQWLRNILALVVFRLLLSGVYRCFSFYRLLSVCPFRERNEK